VRHELALVTKAPTSPPARPAPAPGPTRRRQLPATGRRPWRRRSPAHGPPHVGLVPRHVSPSPQLCSSPSAWSWAPPLPWSWASPSPWSWAPRRHLVSFFLCVTSIFFFVLLLKMTFEDDDEARHMIVAKEEVEAGCAIVAKAKEVVKAGSATVA
jgi:hypothetical protein